MNEYSVDPNEIKVATKTRAKITLKKQVKEKMLKELKENGEHKSKVIHLIKHSEKGKLEMSKYMKQLGRRDVNTIFKTRTRMLEVKENYKNKFPDQKCRMCNEADETQEHILQKCPNIHTGRNLITEEYEIHSTSVTLNKRAANKISTVMEILASK